MCIRDSKNIQRPQICGLQSPRAFFRVLFFPARVRGTTNSPPFVMRNADGQGKRPRSSEERPPLGNEAWEVFVLRLAQGPPVGTQELALGPPVFREPDVVFRQIRAEPPVLRKAAPLEHLPAPVAGLARLVPVSAKYPSNFGKQEVGHEPGKDKLSGKETFVKEDGAGHSDLSCIHFSAKIVYCLPIFAIFAGHGVLVGNDVDLCALCLQLRGKLTHHAAFARPADPIDPKILPQKFLFSAMDLHTTMMMEEVKSPLP